MSVSEKMSQSHHSVRGWTARVGIKACYSHYLSFYSGHVIFQYTVCRWTYLPWIQAWPTFKVILSRHQSPILFPLSFTSPSMWYICLVPFRTATWFTHPISHTKSSYSAS